MILLAYVCITGQHSNRFSLCSRQDVVWLLKVDNFYLHEYNKQTGKSKIMSSKQVRSSKCLPQS
jgi:hypothetical protein